MFGKHLWKSDILSKDAGHRQQTSQTYYIMAYRMAYGYYHFVTIVNYSRFVGIIFIVTYKIESNLHWLSVRPRFFYFR